VQVESLSTLGFRNLADQELRLSEGITLLWGPNGSGKTNLLEALYMALAGRSPRTRAERETIAFDRKVGRAEATVRDGTERRHYLCATERDAGKQHRFEGSAAGAEAAEGRPPIAVFMPDRLTLIKGPPAARRSHLDGFVAALRPARADARKRYSRALAQRNALIGRIRAGGASAESLDAWDGELADAGVELMRARADAAGVLAPLFATAAQELGLAAGSEIAYRPRSAAHDDAELRAELRERRDSDLTRGFSGHGPHLDELAISVAGKAARRYASQGQQRTALLALLFAERDALLAERRTAPLLLLDDVTSELDPERRGLLCERLEGGGGQSIVTATEPTHLPAGCQRHEVEVRDGLAIPAASPVRTGDLQAPGHQARGEAA
jgi:DNA replication and repair protein RecF